MNKLSSKFDNIEIDKHYWTDGEKIFHRQNKIKGVDLISFEHFYGIWAKDKKNCFSGSSRINKTDVRTFKALNLTYAKDKESVWTLAGKIKDADAKTFVACDDGKNSLGKSIKNIEGKLTLLDETYVPYGYGKDKKNVYYFNYNGKEKIVKKADSNSFVSYNDGYYGFDKNYVFYGFAIIPKAVPNTWIKLKENYHYSKDGNKIFYFNRLIKDVDAKSFKVVETPFISNPRQLAKDKKSGFRNGNRISFDELKKEIDYYTNYHKMVTNKLK